MRRLAALAATILAASALVYSPRASAAPVLPSGFSDELVTAVGLPTALAFTPDGRMLVTTQPGRLYVVQNGSLIATPALDLSAVTCSNVERGLLGVAIDPNFATNGYVYLYYTFNKFNTCPTNVANDPVNRVSRFVLGSSNTINPATQTVLLDNILSPNGNHNAGDVRFGRDGNLYVTVGDGGCDYAGNSGCGGANDASRDRNILNGKVLRITPTGGIPADNPFQGAGTARCNANGSSAAGTVCQETFAWGLRNPFRIAFDPDNAGTRFYINDVGQNVWEEIDLGTSGADYGWNVREGHCANGSTTNCGAPPAGMTNPIFDYGHTNGCGAITGGAFVPAAAWPAPYGGSYLFSDYNCGRIFRLVPNGSGGFTSTVFADSLGANSAVDMVFNNGALYYTNYANGGEVHRIVVNAPANRPPVASFTATPQSGPVPLNVSFDGRASSDPDGDALTYSWDFGDGTTDTISGATVNHQYSAAGNYTAMLTVRDPSGAPNSTSHTISASNANRPPVASFTATPQSGPVPLNVAFDGTASSDPDGDALTYSWDFGDGTTDEVSGATVSHQYNAGTYTATLTVRDPSNASNATSRTISVSNANRPPVASFTATPQSGPVPLNVAFDGTASSDPDADALTYSWDFGDGNTDEISGATVNHQYNSAGTYTATLTVSDPSGASNATSRMISPSSANTPPSPAVTAPSTTKRFAVGETITLTGNATDAQDGTEPSSRLLWTVLMHNGSATRSIFGPRSGNNVTFTAPSPDSLASAAASYLEIQLTATDSGGLSSTASQRLDALTVNLTFATSPSGRTLIVGGQSIVAPKTFVSWRSYSFQVSAPTPQGGYRFRRWSDGKSRTHTITTPSTNRTYTATFRH